MGKVAPHEANEVRLVLGGLKPLASIEKQKQPILYSLAVSLGAVGMLHLHFLTSTDSPSGELLAVLPRNKHLILKWLYLQSQGVKQFGLKEYHRRMGKLYGYTEADIEAFIAAEIHCNCAKCRG